MRKAQKRQAEEFVMLLGQAHDEIRKHIEVRKNDLALDLLEQCQEGAIALGNLIEKTEGERCNAILLLEEYCEMVYRIHEDICHNEGINVDNGYHELQKALLRIESSIQDDIKVRFEIAFLPYKASMWDSLESVWMAAAADPNFDTYVVPIPYYERNGDGILCQYRYEGDSIPDYVPITNYNTYNLEERHPDIIYIHNPYDQGNYVTSVDPRYYSGELKKHSELLMYIPYYTTSGGMSEGQSLLPAYLNVDYIVIQADKYKKFFHPAIPKEKFLPLGSPKFDSIIRICNNPPEIPVEWKDKMQGKKVYFYNTSINGMLYDTKRFLLKMEYVFNCFEGRKNDCLLWRPHPLLESTLDSLRKDFRPFYDELKQYFIQNNLGIYDDSPEIEKTIALSDAYIGDSGTSVTSLFGIVGKPMFILNNFINTLPEKDDWRGEIINGFPLDGYDDWRITQGNKLYYSPNHDYQYEYYCDLSEYSSGNYYITAMEIDGRVYVCPQNAQDILVIEDHMIINRIQLERHIEQMGAFAAAWKVDHYLFLIPMNYPAIVRYDIKQNKVDYLSGYNKVFSQTVKGEWRVGGSCIWNKYLLIASPSDNRVLVIESATLKTQIVSVNLQNNGGCFALVPEEEDIWILPYTGKKISRWNPETGAVREYSDLPDEFSCKSRPLGVECDDRPFSMVVFHKNSVILSPCWGNMFVSIDKETGKTEKWNVSFELKDEGKNGYWMSWGIGTFMYQTDMTKRGFGRFYSEVQRKLYDINLESGESREVVIGFNEEELYEHESGFCEESEWLQYCCNENAFQTLPNFLDGKIYGNVFDRERQIQAYARNAANNDGTSGEKIHQFTCSIL